MNIIKSYYGQMGKLLYPLHSGSDDVIKRMQKTVKKGELSLTRTQKAIIIHHTDLTKKIPRAEVTKHVEFIRKLIPTTMVTGSYRRGAKQSSDIDIVVRESIDDVVKKLTDAGYIKDTFSQGSKKFSGVVKLPGLKTHRHLDIIFTTPRSYPFAMLYFTGSKRFNIIMRLKAKKKGLKLNEYGLFNGSVQTGNITTERDIFKALGAAYVEPRDR